jgi:type IV pilus assembly protein PilC
MPLFIWEGRTLAGIPQRGELEAPDELNVRLTLRRRGIIVTRIRRKPRELPIPLLSRRIRKRDLLIFTQQLAAMLDAGIPLVQALEILIEQTENRAFRQVIRDVKERIEGGSTLAQALRAHPKVFDRLYVDMVVAGEESGNLDLMLKRIATHIEKMENLKRKVRSALIYPAIIFVVAIVVTIVLLVFVIPTFEKLFSEVNMSLPLPTQIVIKVSKFTKANIPYVIGGLFLLVLFLRYYYKTEAGRFQIDSLLLKLPIFGILIKKIALARFARTLSTLVKSGVPILESLEIVGATSGNKRIEKAVKEARENLREGESLASPLERSGVFPLMVTHMIGVGEATGNLDLMLEKVADFYEADVDQAVANLSSMIEPLLIVFLGVVIGGLVVSMYLPVFKMAAAF